jgi:hypothetical protein
VIAGGFAEPGGALAKDDHQERTAAALLLDDRSGDTSLLVLHRGALRDRVLSALLLSRGSSSRRRCAKIRQCSSFTAERLSGTVHS